MKETRKGPVGGVVVVVIVWLPLFAAGLEREGWLVMN